MDESAEPDPRRGRFPCPRCQRVLRVTGPYELGFPFTIPGVKAITSAFRGYICDACGPIPFSELPGDAKVIKILMGVATTLLLFLTAVCLYASLTGP